MRTHPSPAAPKAIPGATATRWSSRNRSAHAATSPSEAWLTSIHAHQNSLLLGWYDRLQDLQHLSIARRAVRITADPAAVVDQHRELLRLALEGDHLRFASVLDEHQADDSGV